MFSKDNMQKHLCAQFLPCSGKPKSCEVPAKASTLWRCGGMKVWWTWALQCLKWKDGVPCFGCLFFCFYPLFHTSNQRCGHLFQAFISSYFIIKKTPNAVDCCLLSYIFNKTYMQFSCFEQWNRRFERMSACAREKENRQKDPSRPKDSSTEQIDIIFEK